MEAQRNLWPQTHARWIGGRLGSPKLVRGWALRWEWLGAWISGFQASKGLILWVWRRPGLETQERGSLAPQKEGSWDFALLSFGREKEAGGGGAAGVCKHGAMDL